MVDPCLPCPKLWVRSTYTGHVVNTCSSHFWAWWRQKDHKFKASPVYRGSPTLVRATYQDPVSNVKQVREGLHFVLRVNKGSSGQMELAQT